MHIPWAILYIKFVNWEVSVYGMQHLILSTLYTLSAKCHDLTNNLKQLDGRRTGTIVSAFGPLKPTTAAGIKSLVTWHEQVMIIYLIGKY